MKNLETLNVKTRGASSKLFFQRYLFNPFNDSSQAAKLFLIDWENNHEH